TRYSGSGAQETIYGSQGVMRKWDISSQLSPTISRSVTAQWLSNEDNGNVMGDLKVWKYEASKGDTKSDKDIVIKKKMSFKPTAKAGVRAGREFTEDIPGDDIDILIVESDPKTLGWVEVDGASFNTASSPRTTTFIVSSATSYTVNDILNAFADGSGTESNPYQIETLDQLNAVRGYLTACFIQIADIDATPTTTWNAGAGWDPIDNLTGKYNGDGHTVSNLFIDRSGMLYVGLFGYTTSGSEIKDMGLINVDITGGDYTGGFVGYSRGTVKNIYTKGQISSSTGDRTGGFVGYATSGSSIYDCYANVEVTRLTGGTDENAGGFCGYHVSGPIERCYSTGGVYYEGTTDPTNKGFLALSGGGTRDNNFWNTETSGQTSSADGTGITTNEMRTLSTFTNATWDFQDESANGVEDIWGMNYAEHNAFPFLSWQGITHDPISGFAGGMGTESEPYLISIPSELDNVRNFLGVTYDNTYFLQTADLDLSGYSAGDGWFPLGTDITNSFRGNYEGDRYNVSNLLINRVANYQSLFGYISTASINNLDLVSVDITGTGYVAGLAGYMTNSSTITNCSVEGQLDGSGSYIAPIAGYVINTSVISNSFANAQSRGVSYVAGVAARLGVGSQAVNCYAMGSASRISGTSTFMGGIAGYNNASKIIKCYSTVEVIHEDTSNPTNKGITGGVSAAGDYEMSDNFWDIETSGQLTSSGVATGKTIAEMQDVATYTNTATAGLTNPWDFVGNPNNDVANDDIWNIHISLNGGYPYFEYEGRIPVLAPGNIALVYLAGDVTLTWDAVTDAAGYAVYSSADPYGTFTLDESGAFNGEEWTVTVGDSKMFYFVTATNATKETPKQISMSNKIESR
ncbi:MAG: hypothetical protein KAH33_02070, partial [Candidatus Delongbacteria bacterium]|nr:hypothetical protein [Candidatus Delongbacteria bacterium]